jgi:hypothetical protein
MSGAAAADTGLRAAVGDPPRARLEYASLPLLYANDPRPPAAAIL